jgi:DNA mismatch repair protein MutL
VGTTVEVRDLFGDVPARRKFLRADSTETGHVAEAVTLLALAHPETGFSLVSGGRVMLQAPPVSSPRERAYQVFGGGFLDQMLPVEAARDWVRVSGWVSRPETRVRRAVHRLFVNRRPVRDRSLSKAIAEGSQAAAGQRPEAILFLEVPPHLVDVNVHPAKTEVRFADTRIVWSAVQGAVRSALSLGVRDDLPRAESSRIEEAASAYVVAPEPHRCLAFGGVRSGVEAGRTTPPEVAPIDAAEPSAGGPAALQAIGQHRSTYIVATDGEDLILVDQHTAHERVRFETLLERLEARRVESQALLSPMVLHLPPELLAVVEANAESLLVLGFDVEDFGAGSLRLRAVPALLGAHDAASALTALLRDYLEAETGRWVVSSNRERLAATLACHSAVRAGQVLSMQSMQTILQDLLQTAHPTLCPHGRPTTVRIPREDISRWFGRTGWKRR